MGDAAGRCVWDQDYSCQGHNPSSWSRRRRHLIAGYLAHRPTPPAPARPSIDSIHAQYIHTITYLILSRGPDQQARAAGVAKPISHGPLSWLALPTDSCSLEALRYVMHRSRPRVPCHPDGDDDRYRDNCKAYRPTRADLILADRFLAPSTSLCINSPARDSESRAPIATEGCKLDSDHGQLDQVDNIASPK